MSRITYFHRNPQAGYSINKVTQTIISEIEDKEEYYMPENGAGIFTVMKNIFFIFRHRNKNGINHITGDIHYGILGLIGCKSVLTIHDTVSVDYNKYSVLKKKFLELFWFRIPIKLADKVVCISEETRKSISRFTNRKDICVIHNAVDNSITYLTKEFMDLNDQQAKLLVIGTNPNKNLDGVVKSVAGLNVKLIIVGLLNKNQSELLQSLKISFENKQNLSDEEINNLYHSSDVLLFCSFFEGFGMPIIEANKAGCPVIASNLPVLKEVGGDSALYVEPNDVNEIRNTILKLLNNPNLQRELVNNGFINVKRFSPDEIREKWLTLYQSV